MRGLVIGFALVCALFGTRAFAAETQPSSSPSPSPTPSPTPSPYAQLTFRNVGPSTAGGRLTSVAGTDRDPALYFIGAADGGVWKSTNAGTDWKPLFDDQAVAAIGAVAIDPSNANTVWAGTGEANPRNDVVPGNGIYVTTDGGTTWKLSGLEGTAAIGKIWIDPHDSKTIVVAALGDPFADNSARGIYRTTDGGATWNKVLYVGPAAGGCDLASSLKASNTIFACLWHFRRTGWSARSGGPDDGLYRSSDGGASWQKLQGHGLPTDTLGRIGLAVAPSNPRRVYATIESSQGRLWRSDDGGDNWQLVSSDSNINQRPFYFSRLYVDPTNEDHVFSDSVHLVVSTDGGKTWKKTGERIHGDHHAMWIAQDGKRIIEGNDGGVAFSHDGGASWEWRNTIPIGQLYHIGFDRGNPYRVCAPLQDNGVWCAPNRSLTPGGVVPAQWEDMGGGDGAWVIPEPGNPNFVWSTSGGGNNGGELDILDERTKQNTAGSAYLRDQNVTPPSQLRYRFNWETPIAFDPFDPHTAYTAGNVVFKTRDRGQHWSVISPDLTRNVRSHEAITGGVQLEGTGAETSETILYIEPSSAARGEMWIGTDDGLVQLTRDGGKHWSNVTPAGVLPFGRFASISASHDRAGQAYGIYDAHMIGDKAPHVFKTVDFGRHWSAITSGLPSDEYARSIRQDPRNPSMVYLGTEFAFYVSFDGGARWQAFRQNLPAASIRDIRVHPDFNDLLIGTHGRSAWILDDATPLQLLARAQAAGSYLFPIRRAYLYEIHSGGNDFLGAGQNPPYGAIITFYLNRPTQNNATADVLDEHGRVVRHFRTHVEDGKDVPDLSNQVGFNRFSWDLTEDKPVPWDSSGDWNQFQSGAPVMPGRYTIVLHSGNRVLRAPLTVRRDPRDDANVFDHAARYRVEHRLYADWSRIDEALNTLSTIQREVDARKEAIAKSSPGDTILSQLDAIRVRAVTLQATITSNPQSDQDDDFLKDLLRERVQSQIFLFDSFKAPTAEEERESNALHALTNERVHAVGAFVTSLGALNGQLSHLKLPALQRATTAPQKPDTSADESDRRGSH